MRDVGSATNRRSEEPPRRALRVAGLFAGIGGLELGLERAGHQTVVLCENDRGAKHVLRQHFAGVELRGDVRRLRAKDIQTNVDVLTAGFPCQDLSQAGATAGIGGEKSSLVGEVFRLLSRRTLPWVVLENVPFMLHLDRGRAMRRIVERLEELGYRWAYRVVDAMAFGLPQRRRRVFLVASRQHDPAPVLLADEASPPRQAAWQPERAVGFYWTEGNRGVGWAVDAVPTLKGGSGLGIPSAPAVLLPDGRVVHPSIEGVERLQGFPAGWTEPAARAVPDRYRWRMVGNAVSVRAAEWLGRRIAEPGVVDPGRLGDPIGPRDSWPSAACSHGGGRIRVRIGEWPERVDPQPIDRFLGGAKPLSKRATLGFVSRAERAQRNGKLTFPSGFLERLRDHAESLRQEVG